jgi:aminoglycoside 6-adenylyltransferase
MNDPFSHTITAWAAERPAVRAVILCGSQARTVYPADQWSDYDYEVYVTDWRPFVENCEWLAMLGRTWTQLVLEEDGCPVFLLLLAGGEKVDFHFYPAGELEKLVANQALNSAYYRGYRVLVDKDGLAGRLPPPAVPPNRQPTAEEFLACVHGFWYGAVYVAKQIRWRNLWVVKFRNGTIKASLLKMIEWQAQARHGRQYDTWNDGHFLSRWTDEETWAALAGTYGHFDPADSWTALLNTITLFNGLARETAGYLEVPYPVEVAEEITGYVKGLYAADE